MAWTYLFIAGLFEIGWAIGLKYTEGYTKLIPTVLTLAGMGARTTSSSSTTSPAAWIPSSTWWPENLAFMQ